MAKRAKLITYWVITILLALVFISGGVVNFMRQPQAVAGMARLGYPAYMATILGFWKILGGIAILAPGLKRAKEWAYAGIFFDLTGAAASHAASADYGAGWFHIIVPLVLAGLAVISWGLRPASRRL